jgi:hypothetical protein
MASYANATQPVGKTSTPKASTTIEPIWSHNISVSAPESVYFDDEASSIYISNVAGQPDQKDGKGWIQKLTQDGQIVNPEWVKGLNAPKGMRVRAGVLWVTDIDELVSISTKSGLILSVIPIQGAKFLNDVAIDATDGAIYVSDTIGGKIYRLRDGKVEVFAEGDHLESPNGLLLRDGQLIVAAWGLTRDWTTKVKGTVYALDLKSKEKRPITRAPTGNLDGLEVDQDGSFLVSDWVAGQVMKIQSDGKVSIFLQGFKGSADIGWIAAKRTLLVPVMGEDRVSAYDLSGKSGKL